jgi:hypothetical protein
MAPARPVAQLCSVTGTPVGGSRLSVGPGVEVLEFKSGTSASDPLRARVPQVTAILYNSHTPTTAGPRTERNWRTAG